MNRKMARDGLRLDLEALLHESLATADATQFFETAAHIAMAVDAFQMERENRQSDGASRLKSAPN